MSTKTHSHSHDEHDHGARITQARGWWYVLFALTVATLGFGLFSFYNEEHYGTIVTGMRTPGYGGASWGLYIVFVVFYIGVSFAGIVVAALARLLDIKELAPVSRMAELLTLTALVSGATCVLADLGRPVWGIMTLPRLVNPSSPFFGTFTLVVSGYMFSSAVYFFLAGRADAAAMAKKSTGLLRLFHIVWASGYKDLPSHRRRHRAISFVLSLGILPLLLVAHSTLGFVFGIQSGRPGWFSALQAPGFVVLAGVSGTGMLIILTLVFRWLFRLHDQIEDKTIVWLGNFMCVLAAVYLYFMVAEELTATYAAPAAERAIAHEIVTGRFALLFWATALCLLTAFIIPFLFYLRGKSSMLWLGIAGALANVAAVGKRIIIVVPSQTHGAFVKLEPGSYWPTWVEIGVVAGLAAIAGVVLLVFGRVFPLVPSHHAPDPVVHPAPRESTWRYLATGVTFFTSVALIVVGLLDSFRVFSPAEIDPRVPFAPVIFASGVMLLFISAIVYEVFPEPKVEPWEEPRHRDLPDFSWDTGYMVEEKLHADDSRRVARLAIDVETALRNGEQALALDRLHALQKLASRMAVE